MSETRAVDLGEPGGPRVRVESAASVSKKVPLALLLEPHDPMRHNMDDGNLLELIDSIREHGLMQNLCVIPVYDGCRVRIEPATVAGTVEHERRGGRYEVRAGHRRLLALRSLSMYECECKIYCDPASSEKAIMAQENTNREEPSDFDLAVMYREWMAEPEITEKELARRAGKGIEFIYGRAQILDGWKEVADALHEKKISFTVARELNREDEEAYMKHFLNMAIDQGAKARLVHAWVAEHAATKAMAVAPGPGGVAGPTITTAPPIVSACIACGDRQSYNLMATLICFGCRDALKIAREQVEAAEAASEQSAPSA